MTAICSQSAGIGDMYSTCRAGTDTPTDVMAPTSRAINASAMVNSVTVWTGALMLESYGQPAPMPPGNPA
jgi:primase-polymerase (primpol)-like protein